MVFERFTDRARKVVVLAQEEARLAGASYIGTEHVLLGLIHEGGGVAATALDQLGVSLEAVRVCVEEIIGTGSLTSGHIEYTPRAKKVLELSLREALQLGHNYIGTEHILLGLIREGEGVAAQVLVKLGADVSRVRQQVMQLLSGYAEGQSLAAETEADDKLGVTGYLENLRVRARECGIAREEQLTRAVQLMAQAVEMVIGAQSPVVRSDSVVKWVASNGANPPVAYIDGAFQVQVSAKLSSMTVDQRLAVEGLIRDTARIASQPAFGDVRLPTLSDVRRLQDPDGGRRGD